MQTTKKIENIPGLQKSDWAIIKKLNYGEQTNIAGGSIKIDAQTRMSQKKKSVDVDFGEIMRRTLVYGIKEASFFSSQDINDKLEAIMNLPGEAGSFLFNEVTTINGVQNDEETTKN